MYVDDLIITGGDMEVLRRFKRKNSTTLKMSDLGALSYYLSIEVQQSTAGITICQSAYVKKLLDTTRLADSNSTRTPMQARLQLRKAGTKPAIDATNSIEYVSRFMEAPREEHLMTVKCIMRYAAGTRGWGVRYCAGRGRKKLELVEYNDSDMPMTLMIVRELAG